MNNHVELIRLSNTDLDRPLYRIYPIWFFENALQTNGGNLALVPPSAWRDRHEDICSWVQMVAPDYSQKSLVDYLSPAYAQCWSFEGNSDVLLRAYSRVDIDKVTGRNTEPKFEGVKVRTTPRRIMSAIEKFSKSRSTGAFSFYLAAVEYIDDVQQAIVNELNKIGPRALGQGWNRARSLTFKRKAFQHEQEVRLIALTQVEQDSIVLININPNEVFEEIQFDPRLGEFERREREDRVRSFGYAGRIIIDDLYQTIFFPMQLIASWDQLDAQAQIQGIVECVDRDDKVNQF